MAALIEDLIIFFSEHPATMLTFTVVLGLILGVVANIIINLFKGAK